MPKLINTNEVRSLDLQRVDSRLAAVIERYESRPEATKQSAREEDDIDSLRERLSRIPQITDPKIYNVRVHVGMFLVPPNLLLTLAPIRMGRLLRRSVFCKNVSWDVRDSHFRFFCHQAAANGSPSKQAALRMYTTYAPTCLRFATHSRSPSSQSRNE